MWFVSLDAVRLEKFPLAGRNFSLNKKMGVVSKREIDPVFIVKPLKMV